MIDLDAELERRIAARWRLTLGDELAAPATCSAWAVRLADGGEAVLKLAGPSEPARHEIACLRAWRGAPAPLLLDADEDAGALLLERIVPGSQAVDAAPEDVALLLAVMGAADLPDDLPLLVDRVRDRLDRTERAGRTSGARLAWARSALSRLDDDQARPALVHGRFDARTVLRCARRGLCAVDPLPCAGDPTYDAACWIHAGGSAGRRARFNALCSAAGLDRSRVRDWCGIAAVHG